MTPNKRLWILRYYAEGVLQGTATQGELDVAIHEACAAGCDADVVRQVCEAACERVVATMQTEQDTNA